MTGQKETPPTVITLTLPQQAEPETCGTLLVQRGDLARVHQFTYTRIADLAEIIADALITFAAVEANPPVVPDLPEEKPKPTATKAKATRKPQRQVEDEEPTIDIPLKKGTKAIRLSHLRIVGGETDAAAYRQAVLIAGRLIDGKLWDGETPIRIDDVYATLKKMQHLTDKDFSLFRLEDFVQTGAVTETVNTSDEDHDTEDFVPAATVSLNGHHPADTTTLL